MRIGQKPHESSASILGGVHGADEGGSLGCPGNTLPPGVLGFKFVAETISDAIAQEVLKLALVGLAQRPTGPSVRMCNDCCGNINPTP